MKKTSVRKVNAKTVRAIETLGAPPTPRRSFMSLAAPTVPSSIDPLLQEASMTALISKAKRTKTMPAAPVQTSSRSKGPRVYGPADHSQSAEFLGELQAKVTTVTAAALPVLVGGDFNLIKSGADKNNTHTLPRAPPGLITQLTHTPHSSLNPPRTAVDPHTLPSPAPALLPASAALAPASALLRAGRPPPWRPSSPSAALPRVGLLPRRPPRPPHQLSSRTVRPPRRPSSTESLVRSQPVVDPELLWWRSRGPASVERLESPAQVVQHRVTEENAHI
nr:lysine-rich arabinogalactan protein 19-like [Aegilops tauschii subsp. strangulata]